MKKRNVKKNVKEHSKFYWKFFHLLFDYPVIKFMILVILNIVFLNTQKYFPENIVLRWILFLPGFLINIYFIVLIIHVLRVSYQKLMNPKNILTLIGAYALFVLALLLIFSMIYNFIELGSYGYITYSECNGIYNSDNILKDPEISRDYFYFTAITFFTVGYGDICPMGMARYVSIIVSFIGHLVSVIIVALVIHNYFRKQYES